MNRPAYALFGVALCLMPGTLAIASDLRVLAEQGWEIVGRSVIAEAFKGCKYGLRFRLEGGGQFICEGYQYHYAYRPELIVLRNSQTAGTKILIDGEEFTGRLAY